MLDSIQKPACGAVPGRGPKSCGCAVSGASGQPVSPGHGLPLRAASLCTPRSAVSFRRWAGPAWKRSCSKSHLRAFPPLPGSLGVGETSFQSRRDLGHSRQGCRPPGTLHEACPASHALLARSHASRAPAAAPLPQRQSQSPPGTGGPTKPAVSDPALASEVTAKPGPKAFCCSNI